jgi:preprotein translocase subunit YajC
MAQAAGGGSSGLMQMAPLVLIFVVFYVLVIRPQSKKAKELQNMLKELKVKDDGWDHRSHHRPQG